MKKIISVAVGVILMFGVFGMFGCATYKGEYGDFVCKFYDTKNTVDINGLSEEGKKKKILAIPKEINGYTVDYIGKKMLMGTGNPDISSENLEVIYFTQNLDGRFWYQDCPNLKKAFLIENGVNREITKVFEINENTSMYMSNFYISKFNADNRVRIFPANISYFYNYEGAPNDGYYWIDDMEDGETIKYIPENPIREGYLFGGWFKDEACTEVWDFEKDTIVKPADGYYENILYAKWNKR